MSSARGGTLSTPETKPFSWQQGKGDGELAIPFAQPQATSALSLATSMGPGGCHELGTTSGWLPVAARASAAG